MEVTLIAIDFGDRSARQLTEQVGCSSEPPVRSSFCEDLRQHWSMKLDLSYQSGHSF